MHINFIFFILRSTNQGLQADFIKTLQVAKINFKPRQVIWESNTDRHFKIATSFDYAHEVIRFALTSGHIKFIPIATKLFFMKQSLCEIHYDSKEVIKCLEIFNSQVSFDNCNIDVFGFKKDRIFIIDFFYKIPGYNHMFDTRFSIKLPEIKTAAFISRSPKTKYPSDMIRRICDQDFKMNERNSFEEIQICMNLEIFKQTDLSTRYQTCGYLNMLRTFLDIENSFEQILADKCRFTDAQLIRLHGLNFRIMVNFINFIAAISLVDIFILFSFVKRHLGQSQIKLIN
jgi:hypothetical protein